MTFTYKQNEVFTMKTRLIVLFLLALSCILPCLAMAAEQDEPTIYIIKRGDTLWGLSERFIKDPNYWPNMWSKNDQITNPHVIYPGQRVRSEEHTSELQSPCN